MRKVYLDHAATTYLIPEVASSMKPYYDKVFGNPSSIHQEGRKAKYALFKVRKEIAEILNCKATEIIFTGSGTESCNLAIFGVIEAVKSKFKNKKPHIITSRIEHSAVLKPCQKLEREGIEVTYLPVNKEGIVKVSDLERAIRSETILVSIMYANNEIGTIQPIQEIGRLIKKINNFRLQTSEFRILFHTDACQAAGFLDLDCQKLGVDLLTLNASKIYGPKGVGLLFVKEGTPLNPMILGGGQESGLRSGTENLAGIVGLTKALEIAQKNRIKESKRLKKLRDYLIYELEKRIPKVILNGSKKERLPNNVNISILDVEGEAVLLWLDKYGISASTGSACDSQTLEPSHVILALARPYEYAHGSLRFTLGKRTKKEDIDYLIRVLPKIVKKLRAISPVKIEIGKKEPGLEKAFLEKRPYWEKK